MRLIRRTASSCSSISIHSTTVIVVRMNIADANKSLSPEPGMSSHVLGGAELLRRVPGFARRKVCTTDLLLITPVQLKVFQPVVAEATTLESF